MDETISLPPGMLITTSVLTGPFLIIFTVPAIWLRALIFTQITNPYCVPGLFEGFIRGKLTDRYAAGNRPRDGRNRDNGISGEPAMPIRAQPSVSLSSQ